MRGIGFGDADGLGALDGFVERAALFHFGKDDVGGGIQDAGETAQFRGWESEGKEREDRRAIHDRGLEQKLLALYFGQSRNPLVIVDKRPFIGADGVSTGFERGDQMVDRRLAGMRVE